MTPQQGEGTRSSRKDQMLPTCFEQRPALPVAFEKPIERTTQRNRKGVGTVVSGNPRPAL
jgi:hypothetical protein